MNKKSISTFDREMKNAKFKKAFVKSYKELLLSEMLIAIMESNVLISKIKKSKKNTH